MSERDAILRELANLYTVHTDQHAVISLQCRAKAIVYPTVPPTDNDHVRTVIYRMADELSSLVLKRGLNHISLTERLDLVQRVRDVVHDAIEEYMPAEQTEPCAMSAAKYEAERP
jgi:hypothetical protein